MRSCRGMTFEPAMERGGPWGRDLFTFVTSAACHMMRTLQKPRKNRPSKRQVNHRRFLHNMIQRKFADIEAANHQLASALFCSSGSNTQSDSLPSSQPTCNQSHETCKEGPSVSSPQRGSDVSQHEAAADLWGLDAHTDLPEDTTIHPGQPCGVNLGSQRLKDSSSYGATAAGGSMPSDPALTHCQPDHTLAHLSDPSSEEAQCCPALTGVDSLPCLPNTLAVEEITQWLDGTSHVQRTSPHLLSPKSPDMTKELLFDPSLDEAMMFDFVPSSPDISPLSLDTCDFGIQMFTGADRTPNHQPSPHPGDLQADLGGTLDLLDSEELESDQQDSRDSPITMTTYWSSYFDRMSPSGIQDDGTHPGTQSNGCSIKQQVGIHGFQDGGSSLANGSNCSSHTVKATDISHGEETQKQDPQRVSLDSDPEERPHNLYSHRGKDIIRSGGPLQHINYLSTHEESMRSYAGKPETSHLSYEDIHMDHNDCYNPSSDAQDQDYNYYQICPLHNSTIKDQGVTLSRLPEEFWVEKPKDTTELPAGTKAALLTETHPELISHSGDKDTRQLDYIADCIQILSGLRSVASGVPSQHPHLNTEARATCSEAAGYSSAEQASVHLSITGADSSHRSHPCLQSSCLQSDHTSLWSNCSSSSRCPFVGVAASFPAPAPQPRPCQVATPPLQNDLLFNDIMEEEMSLDLTGGSYGFHLASHN